MASKMLCGCPPPFLLLVLLSLSLSCAVAQDTYAPAGRLEHEDFHQHPERTVADGNEVLDGFTFGRFSERLHSVLEDDLSDEWHYHSENEGQTNEWRHDHVHSEPAYDEEVEYEYPSSSASHHIVGPRRTYDYRTPDRRASPPQNTYFVPHPARYDNSISFPLMRRTPLPPGGSVFPVVEHPGLIAPVEPRLHHPPTPAKVCCQDCPSGDLYCFASCIRTGCMKVEVCSAASKGVYASFCEAECGMRGMSVSSLAMTALPEESCRGYCASQVQTMCQAQSCLDFGCEVRDCMSRAPTKCG